jgi:leucyl-tRNA synthetase
MKLLNEIEDKDLSKEEIETFFKLLAPFAPHITEELWQNLSKTKKFVSIHQEKWPIYDPRLIKEDTFELVIQVNGKMRGLVKLPVGTSEEEAKKTALELENIKQHLKTEPRKIIFVPDRLINFVI